MDEADTEIIVKSTVARQISTRGEILLSGSTLARETLARVKNNDC